MCRPTEEQYQSAIELGQLLAKNNYKIISCEFFRLQ